MEIGGLYTARKHNEGSEMQICDEFNNPLDMWITVAGADSDIWQKATRDKQQRALRRLVAKDEDEHDYDLDDMVAASLDWRGVEENGKELEFSKARVRKLYEQAPYIKDQVVLFTSNRANFTVSQSASFANMQNG